MVMGEVPEEVDIAVIGGGVGGYTAARVICQKL